MNLLEEASVIVAEHMDDILQCFKGDDSKITVLVRQPGLPERDFCMSNDDLAEVAAMVERRRAAGMNVTGSE